MMIESSSVRRRTIISPASGLPGTIAGISESPPCSAASREFSFNPPWFFSPWQRKHFSWRMGRISFRKALESPEAAAFDASAASILALMKASIGCPSCGGEGGGFCVTHSRAMSCRLFQNASRDRTAARRFVSSSADKAVSNRASTGATTASVSGRPASPPARRMENDFPSSVSMATHTSPVSVRWFLPPTTTSKTTRDEPFCESCAVPNTS